MENAGCIRMKCNRHFFYLGVDFSYINIYGTDFRKHRDQCP